MTAFTWLKTMIVHCLLWGNAYTEIQRDGANQIAALWPRNPARTRAIRLLRPITLEGTVHPAGTLIFETTESLMDNTNITGAENQEMSLGTRRLVLAEDMIHVPGLSLDGRVGQSTIWLTRQIIGLALATEKYGAKFFGNGARPAGVLTIPTAMENTAIENLRRSWAEAHGGENQFKVAVLEAGVKFEKIAATPEEGQMLGTREYQRGEICAVFNVPQHMVAALEKQGKGTVEQSSIEFVLYCLSPWIRAWEQELERKLFPKLGRTANQFFPHFDKRHLLYPDAESRAKFYSSGLQNRYLCPDDVREIEGLNPLPDGTGGIFTMQVNMVNSKALLEGGMADGAKPPAPVAPAIGGKTPSQPASKKKPGQKRSDESWLENLRAALARNISALSHLNDEQRAALLEEELTTMLRQMEMETPEDSQTA
jgi:HK97 family phage portal protein